MRKLLKASQAILALIKHHLLSKGISSPNSLLCPLSIVHPFCSSRMEDGQCSTKVSISPAILTLVLNKYS